MKNRLAGMAAAVLAGSLLFVPVKEASASDFHFYGQLAADVNSSSSLSVQHVPDYVSDPFRDSPQQDMGLNGFIGAASLELRLGVEYRNPNFDWFSFKVGPKADFSANGTSGIGVVTEGMEIDNSESCYGLIKTPQYSFNPGVFARASFLDDIFFAEYSASFGNEVSMFSGTETYTVNNAPMNITSKIDINDYYTLGTYIDHSLNVGVHIPLKDKGIINFVELYGGAEFSEITSTTNLGSKVGLSSSNPGLKLGIKAGIEIDPKN